MITFELDAVPLPAATARGTTKGSALVHIPGTARVLMSLPPGRSPVRLCAADIGTRTTWVSPMLDGELRDGFVEDDGEGWLLTSNGVSRIRAGERAPELLDAMRPRGLGREQRRVFPFGPEHVAVTGIGGSSLSVLSRKDGEVAAKLRVPSPVSVVGGADSVLLYAPWAGTVVEVGLDTLAEVGRREIPVGGGPVAADGELVMLRGRSRETPVGTVVEPAALVALDLRSLTALRSGPPPAGVREILGSDTSGRLVLSTDDGVAVVDTQSLLVVKRVAVPGISASNGRFLLVPGLDAVVVLTDEHNPRELSVVRWVGRGAPGTRTTTPAPGRASRVRRLFGRSR